MIHHSDGIGNFEKKILEIMIEEECTLSQALECIFSLYNVDTRSVFDLVDFLEEQLHDLDKVQTMMLVYTGRTSDFQLVRLYDDKTKNEGSNKS